MSDSANQSGGGLTGDKAEAARCFIEKVLRRAKDEGYVTAPCQHEKHASENTWVVEAGDKNLELSLHGAEIRLVFCLSGLVETIPVDDSVMRATAAESGDAADQILCKLRFWLPLPSRPRPDIHRLS